MSDAIELPDEVKELAAQCNEKHVRVVQAILSGNFSSNTKAYQSVYADQSDDSARSAVARMLAIDSVAKLRHELKELKLLEGVLSRAEAMSILSDMARTNIGDLVNFRSIEVTTEDGSAATQAVWDFKDKGDIPEHALRSIAELAATPQGLKIKQHDQKAAIKQLSEMAGWDAPKKVDIGRFETDFMNDIVKTLKS